MIAAAILWSCEAQAATPSSWKDTGFSINANGMTLGQVLKEFGLAYGVRLDISVKDQGLLKGRLKAESGSEFLDRLMHVHDFRWFVYNDTLYIVPRSDNTSVRLEVGEDAVQDAKSALVGVGLFDSRFGWGELPDEGVVLVNGPREYVNLAREVLLPITKKQTFKGKQVMVFRLKYASANDRVITTRGQKETIPGLKTILTSLLNSDGAEKHPDSGDKFDLASEKRSRTAKSGRGSARETSASLPFPGSFNLNQAEESDDSPRSAKPKTPARDERPRIDADSSLNAIIIYDNGSKRDMYTALIAELDIEPQQIEIEALIVDIDRSKLSDLGVEWGVNAGTTSTTVNSTGANSGGIALPIPGSTILISNAARFYARLTAMEGNGDAKVLAKPTVLTLDNVAAVLDLSKTVYLPLIGERVADLANVTAGTMLRVVPRVVREGAITRVRLEVDIEDGSIGDPAQKTNVTRSTISTQAIVDTHQTLMIGGYHSESVSNNQRKIPLLGDVPLLGGLFRSTSESHSNSERLFLITPRLSGSTGAAAAMRSKAARLAEEIALEDSRKAAAQGGKILPAPAVTDPREAASTQSVPNMSPKSADASALPFPGFMRKVTCGKPRTRFNFGGMRVAP